MKKTLAALALVVVALVAYFSLWPVPIEPIAWPAPTKPDYTGAFAANQRLAALQPAAPAAAAEAGPALSHAATSSVASALVPFKGKLLSANIIQQLQRLPVAPAPAALGP